MELLTDFPRVDYDSPYDEYFHKYLGTEASPDDLVKLLKVKTREDAIEFLDSCGPLFYPNDYTRLKWKDRRPSELPAEELEPLIADVENTLKAMTVALRAFRLLKENIPINKWSEYGFVTKLNVFPDDPEELLTYAPDNFLNEYGDSIMDRLTCHYSFKFNSNGRNSFFGNYSTRLIEGESSFDIYEVSGTSKRLGDSPESYREALQNLLDRLMTDGLEDISFCSSNSSFAIRIREFRSYLWLIFMEKLFMNDIRYCYVCGEPFVANMGLANERGKNPKSNCSDACRFLKVRAEKAKKLIELGIDTEEAAKAAHINIEKLYKYLDLHPIETKGE